MPKVDMGDWQHDAGHHRATGENIGPSHYKLIAQAGGLTQFGAHLELLPPGSKSSPRHRHEGEDEMVLILQGDLVLVEDSETPMTAGDAATWAAGRDPAHCLENRSDTDAVYLVVGTKAAQDVVHFADHDLVLELDNGARRLTRGDGTPV